MDDLTNLADPCFKNPVGGGIGDHQRRQLIPVLLCLGPQIVKIDIAVRVTGHRNHFHPRHHRTSRIGTVSRCGNQTDGALSVAPVVVVGPDHQQSGIFPLGSRIGLKGDASKTRDLSQILFELLKELQVALGLG